jgi:hypothetical protein
MSCRRGLTEAERAQRQGAGPRAAEGRGRAAAQFGRVASLIGGIAMDDQQNSVALESR